VLPQLLPADVMAYHLKLQLLRLSFILSAQQRETIVGLIRDVIKAFNSPEVAADDRHTPKHYARFLRGLLWPYIAIKRKSMDMQQLPPAIPTSTPALPRSAPTTYMPLPDTSTVSSASSGQPPSHIDTTGGPFPTGTFASASSFYSDADPGGLSPANPDNISPLVWTGMGAADIQLPTEFFTDDPMAGLGDMPMSQDQFPIMSELENELWWRQFHMPGFWHLEIPVAMETDGDREDATVSSGRSPLNNMFV
jgi:hypothetical protein